MQNRYVGDVGDFGKYGFLRYLIGTSPNALREVSRLRLSVVWYLYPNESHNFDGKHTGYLHRTTRNMRQFRECDPVLYDVLGDLIDSNQRKVSRIRSSGIFPPDTIYYEESLSYQIEDQRPARQKARERWLLEALEVARNGDLVFVDPDNGIANSAGPYTKKGLKHVFIDDIRQFTELEKSLVIYHHLGRRTTAEEQIRFWSDRLCDHLGIENALWALRFRRGSARVYFVIPNEKHKALFSCRIREFVNSPWKSHFELTQVSVV